METTPTRTLQMRNYLGVTTATFLTASSLEIMGISSDSEALLKMASIGRLWATCMGAACMALDQLVWAHDEG